MDTKSIIVGSHALFFVEGDAITVPGASICAVDSKPGIGASVGNGLDPAWFDLGTVESADPTIAQSDHELWKPSPGRLVLKDILENQQKLTWKIMTNDFGPFAVEAGFRSSTRLTGAQKQFTPLSAISKRGWLHLQHYDHTDTLILTIDQWCRLRPVWKFDATPTKPEWEVFMLYSTLNTGAISP